MMGQSESPLISVAVPNFNYESYLTQCLSSIVEQAGSDVEILVSDNCSTDASWDVICSFADPRIRRWRQTRNIGPYANWNFLLSQARGRLFKLLPSDDWLYPNFVEAIRQLVKSRGLSEPPFVIIHGCHYSAGSGERYGTLVPEVGVTPEKVQLDRNLVATVRALSDFSHPILNVIRTEAARKAGGYTPENAMRSDWLLHLRLLLSSDGNIGVIPEALGSQRVHERNDRLNYSALAPIRDELVASSIVSQAARSTRDRFVVGLWRWKTASHAVFHVVRTYVTSRSGKEARGVAATLMAENLLLAGCLGLPLWGGLFVLSRSIPKAQWRWLANVRRLLQW